jgi:hypothetical protein
MKSEGNLEGRQWVYAVALIGCQALVFVGALVLIFEPRVGVLLILAGAIGIIVARVTAGVLGYRRTMRRPWPKVPPVKDDDDDDDW